MKKKNNRNQLNNKKHKSKQYKKNTNSVNKSSNSIVSKFFTKFGLVPILSGLGLLAAFLIDFKSLKKAYWDDPPISTYSYSNLGTISELKKLNELYDNTGESSYMDRIVGIIAHNFHKLRYENPDNFNDTFSQIDFLNSANIETSNSMLPYMGLINSKILSRDDWHDIEFVARIKEEVMQNNFKSKFMVWWEDQIILNDHKGNKYTRRSIVLNYADNRLNKSYSNANDTEIIKKFEFSGVLSNYNSESGVLTLEGVVFRPSKSTKESVLRNEDVLLFENIRGISGEIAETFEKAFITNNNNQSSK